MDWDKHVQCIVMKAACTLGFLQRNLKIASVKLRDKAYMSFVQPLEHASSVWDPYLESDISQMEAIQRKAARFVINQHHRTTSVKSDGKAGMADTATTKTGFMTRHAVQDAPRPGSSR